MADIEKELGAQTVTEFCQKFGEGKAVFHHCDNTKDEDVKGEVIMLITEAMLLILQIYVYLSLTC